MARWAILRKSIAFVQVVLLKSIHFFFDHTEERADPSLSSDFRNIPKLNSICLKADQVGRDMCSCKDVGRVDLCCQRILLSNRVDRRFWVPDSIYKLAHHHHSHSKGWWNARVQPIPRNEETIFPDYPLEFSPYFEDQTSEQDHRDWHLCFRTNPKFYPIVQITNQVYAKIRMNLVFHRIKQLAGDWGSLFAR